MLVSILPGSFGEVRRGRLQPRGRREQAVAIQALWAGGAESLKMTFLGRAALLGQFQHPNILRLEGVVTKSRPVMVLTELMELGPLDSFLRVSSALVKGGLWVEESLKHSHFPEDRALCLSHLPSRDGPLSIWVFPFLPPSSSSSFIHKPF